MTKHWALIVVLAALVGSCVSAAGWIGNAAAYSEEIADTGSLFLSPAALDDRAFSPEGWGDARPSRTLLHPNGPEVTLRIADSIAGQPHAGGKPGDQVTMTVTAEGAADMAGMQFVVEFDNWVVEVAVGGVVGGDLPTGFSFVHNTNNGEGFVSIALASATAAGVGSLTVAHITFDLIGVPGGSTDLTFTQASAADGSDTPVAIPVTPVAGVIHVWPEGAVLRIADAATGDRHAEGDSGGQVTMTVTAEGAADMAGIQFRVEFDNLVVQVAGGGVAEGDLPGGFAFVYNVNNEEGFVSIALGSATAAGVGSLAIADITFDLTGVPGGSTDLTFTEVVAADDSVTPVAISVTSLDGSIGIGWEVAVPTLSQWGLVVMAGLVIVTFVWSTARRARREEA